MHLSTPTKSNEEASTRASIGIGACSSPSTAGISDPSSLLDMLAKDAKSSKKKIQLEKQGTASSFTDGPTLPSPIIIHNANEDGNSGWMSPFELSDTIPTPTNRQHSITSRSIKIGKPTLKITPVQKASSRLQSLTTPSLQDPKFLSLDALPVLNLAHIEPLSSNRNTLDVAQPKMFEPSTPSFNKCCDEESEFQKFLKFRELMLDKKPSSFEPEAVGKFTKFTIQELRAYLQVN